MLFAAILPLGASLFVGPLIDRWDRRWTMIANGVASAFILPALDASTPLLMPLSLAIADEAGAAAVLTCFGLGSLVAGVLLAAWGGPQRRLTGILGAMILAGIGGVITGLTESLIVTAAGVFIIGVGGGRGMGFMYILAGFTLAAFALASFAVRPIWRLEDALPDQPAPASSESSAPAKAPGA